MAAVVANKVKRARSSRIRTESLRKKPIQIEIDCNGRVIRKEDSSDDEAFLKSVSKIPPTQNNGGRGASSADINKKGLLPGGTDVDNDLLRKKKMEQLQGSGEDGVYRSNSSANVVLYVGLGMVSVGLVITFVGLGDKGFKTLELKLIGPSLVGCGVFFALLRILFCTVPSCFKSCFACFKKSNDEKQNLIKPKSGVMINNGQQVDSDPRLQQGISSATSSAPVPPPSMLPSNISGARRVGPSPSTVSSSTTHRYPPSHPNFIRNSDSDLGQSSKIERRRNNFSDDDEDDDDPNDEFQQKVIRSTAIITSQPVGAGGGGGSDDRSSSRSHKRPRPVTYDEYSTTSEEGIVNPSSSQHSRNNQQHNTPTISTIPRVPSINGNGDNNLKSGDILLNASNL